MHYDFHHKQFAQLNENAGRIAVAGSSGEITWEQLHEQTEALKSILKNLRITEGAPVLIYGHKECAYAVAMLACIHAGVTYIPADVIYPAERIQKIIAIAGVQVLINCTETPVPFDCAVVIDHTNNVVENRPCEFRVETAVPENDLLQYIMFTSGSTGEPKGVQITKNATLAFLNWAVPAFGFSPGDVFMNQAPFTFDVSLCDLFQAFSLGGTLVLNSASVVKEQEQFISRLQHYHCSVWTSTPSFIYMYLRHPQFNAAALPHLHTFLFMGEELPPRTCTQLKKLFPAARILNAYGPTEATIVTTLVEITPAMTQQTALPIGYPMTGSELLIENPSGERQEGELVICGDHVSTGYFKNEELNSRKFYIHNGRRAFRTGDLAYYENGMLYYLGRNDDQVKLHGFRIELHEITNVLVSFPEVTDAVTVALKRNNEVKKLISFVILAQPVEDLNTHFRGTLEKRLPYYMIPGDIVAVNEFPYNSSHKIDRNKLIENYLATTLS